MIIICDKFCQLEFNWILGHEFLTVSAERESFSRFAVPNLAANKGIFEL
jgi:hypothetical protein